METVVNSSIDPGPTRFPIWALAIPAMPSIGEVILGETEVQLGLFNRCLRARHGGFSSDDVRLGGCDICLGRLDAGTRRKLHPDRIVQVLLAHGILLSQRPDARQIGFCRGPARLLLRDFGFGLLKCGPGLLHAPFGLVQDRLRVGKGRLVLPPIDLKEHLSLADEIAFLVVLFDQISRDLSPEDRVDSAVQGPDPLAVDRHVFLGHFDDLDNRRRRLRLLLLSASKKQKGEKRTKPRRMQRCSLSLGMDCFFSSWPPLNGFAARSPT